MLEEKVEKLTAEVVALRKAIEGGLVAVKGAEGGKAKAKVEDEAPAKGKAKPAAAAKGKAKKVEPEHDEDEVSSALKKAAKEDRPAVKKFFKTKKVADLADLLTHPEFYDEAYDFAQGILEEDDDDSDDDADDDDDDDDDDD